VLAFRSGSADSDGTAESDGSKSSVLTPKVARQNSGLRLRLPLPLVNSSDTSDNSERSPTSVKDVKDKILASSKSILGKVLSPTKEKFAREKVGVTHYMCYRCYTKCGQRLTFTGHTLC
jgi:hypothetical protein